MKPAFTFAEIREAEKSIIEKEGIPSLILMENAGKNAFDVITTIYPDIAERTIVIVCGKGNNAGDGFVIARHFLINSIPVEIFTLSLPDELKGDALENYEVLVKLSSELCTIYNITESEPDILYNYLKRIKGKAVIIDALLGSGIKGSVSGLYENVINQVNKIKYKNKKIDVISVDVPSGLGEDNSGGAIIDACHTITMGAVKTNLLYGRGKENTGQLYVVPIGITNELIEKYNNYNKYIVEEDDVKRCLPIRKKTSYKYSNGKALVIGGSKGLSGAVIMSSLAALRSGSGAVMAAYPGSLSAHFGRKLYEVIKTGLPETDEGTISAEAFDKLSKQLSKADAVLIGPGLSLNSSTAEFLFEVISRCEKPMVIDADALTLLAGNLNLLKQISNKNIILTPHIGEFSKLSGLTTDDITADRFLAVRKFAGEYNVNVILKSETSFACTPEGKIYINNTGNEQLASAGSGDILSGIVVSMLSQTKDTLSAMLCGNYILGRIAEKYSGKAGNRQTALQKDMIDLIPGVITEILE